MSILRLDISGDSKALQWWSIGDNLGAKRSAMRILAAVLLVAHAVAHLLGFMVPWRLLTSADVP